MEQAVVIINIPTKAANVDEARPSLQGVGKWRLVSHRDSSRELSTSSCSVRRRQHAGLALLSLLAGCSDRRLAFQVAGSPAFCRRRLAARKCRGRCRPGDRLLPWTGKVARSMDDFPSFRLRREHYCPRRVDTRFRSATERGSAGRRVVLARVPLRSTILPRLRRQPHRSEFAYQFSITLGTSDRLFPVQSRQTRRLNLEATFRNRSTD